MSDHDHDRDHEHADDDSDTGPGDVGSAIAGDGGSLLAPTYCLGPDEHDGESIVRAMLAAGIDECWARLRRWSPGAQSPPLLLLELTDLRSGARLAPAGLAERLSTNGRSVVQLTAFNARQATLRLCRDGASRLTWNGELQAFLAELPGGSVHRGPAGFDAALVELTGTGWDTLLRVAGSRGEDDGSGELHGHAPGGDPGVEDVQTVLLLRGRVLGIPPGMPRRPELFFFHVAIDPGTLAAALGLQQEEDLDQDEGDEEDEGVEEDGGEDEAVEEDGGEDEAVEEDGEDDAVEEHDDDDDVADQMTLLLIDRQLCDHLWNDVPAAELGGFLAALQDVGRPLLGPLAQALPLALDVVRGLDPRQPAAAAAALARAVDPDLLLAYEVLAMGSTLAFIAGDDVRYYDEQFLPLLSLADTPITADALRGSLDEIEGRGVLSAMAEVLPYSVPEGNLLDCFDDDELAPLAEWASGGEQPADQDVYEGSIFLLNTARLQLLVERFDADRFIERIQRFLELWSELAPDGPDDRDAQAALNQAELSRFSACLEQLRMLLALGQANRLQPALLFYG